MTTLNDMLDRALEDIEIGKARPRLLDKVVPKYDTDGSRYPETVRASFSDGRTIVYEIRREQPAPVIVENIRIIRKWKQGYVNQPERRRRRK